jgi:hypothetical protein
VKAGLVGRPLNDDKTILGTLVARIAGGAELVVAAAKFLEVFGFDGFFQID